MSNPTIIPSTQPVDLKLSDEEISKIIETYPSSIVLEAGRYVQVDRGEGAGNSTLDPELSSEYDLFDESRFNGPKYPFTELSTDDELLSYAKSHDLNIDQLRFTRDMLLANWESLESDLVVATVEGESSHGYSHDKIFLDRDKLQARYPGILNDDGSTKFLYSVSFELKHRAAVINVDGINRPNDDELLELQIELETEVGKKGKLLSRFSIGDPTTGRGVFLESKL